MKRPSTSSTSNSLTLCGYLDIAADIFNNTGGGSPSYPSSMEGGSSEDEGADPPPTHRHTGSGSGFGLPPHQGHPGSSLVAVSDATAHPTQPLMDLCNSRRAIPIVGEVGNGVDAKASGNGSPYAPEHFPRQGDVWGWRVGSRRCASSAFWHDRFLYPPNSIRALPNCPPYFRSKLSLEKFLLQHYPNMDVIGFFASFQWRVPATKLTESQQLAQIPRVQEVTEIPVDYNKRSCKVGNVKCGLLTDKSRVMKRMDCNICCSEAEFCGECCCILCGKSTNQSPQEVRSVKCEGKLNEENYCGHVAHLECALLCDVAGVRTSIGIDTEYYCRRCDMKTDLLMYVAELIHQCQSLNVYTEVENNLRLALCIIHGTQRIEVKNLQAKLEAALLQIHSGLNNEGIVDLQRTIAIAHNGSRLFLEGTSLDLTKLVESSTVATSESNKSEKGEGEEKSLDVKIL